MAPKKKARIDGEATGPKKVDPPKKAEPKKAEPKKVEPKKAPEPKKVDPPKKEEPEKVDPPKKTAEPVVEKVVEAEAPAKEATKEAAEEGPKEPGKVTPAAAEAAGNEGAGDTVDGTGEAAAGLAAEQAEKAAAEEPAAAGELEQDAPSDLRPRLQDPVCFLTPDTTLNVMQAAQGGMLMCLNEGGLQYLMAGARASVGIKSGRYMFETRIVEYLNQVEVNGSQARTPMPRNLIRIGFALKARMPIIGDGEDSVAFDSEGNFVHNKKRTAVSQKFGPDHNVAVVLNLNEEAPNKSTVSLFKDGVRVAAPQPLPESLQGKTLYPVVSFRNMTVHVNFGPHPHVPLPFKCRMLQDAAVEDTVLTEYQPMKSDKGEVVFPVMLPDEGTFEWLDWFLERNPHYTELSDRMIVDWAMRSGLWRFKTYTNKSSNDRPDFNFGIPHLDDGSVKQVLAIAATVQQRNYVVMEIKANLTHQDRVDNVARFSLPQFKKIARVLIGPPTDGYREILGAVLLKEKQEKSDADFRARKQERARKRLIEMRQRQVEKARKKAERIKKQMDDKKKKQEVGEAAPEGEEEEAKDDDKDDPEGDKEDAEMAVDDDDEQPPKVELTEREKRDCYRKPPSGAITDLSAFLLGQTFSKFSLPEESEGFDEIEYGWLDQEDTQEYMRRWHLERKISTRMEDLQPSDWFKERWTGWQRDLQAWHNKHVEFKDPNKRASIMAAAIKKAAIKKAMLAKEEKDKDTKVEGAEAKEEAKEEPKEEKGDEKEEKPEAKEEVNNGKQKDKEKADEKGSADKPGETNGAKAEVKKEDAEGQKDEGGDAKMEDKEEEDPMKALEEELDRQELDIFSLAEVSDVGTGEPLFSNFSFEDWALLSLRFELHLLVHAFKNDCNDAERTGIHPDHLAFYYNKYFKKGLNPKHYGVDSIEDLITMIRDTVIICFKVIESQITDDLETNEVFVKLTEESRRERQRRIDAGDDSAVLHFTVRGVDFGPDVAPANKGSAPDMGRTGPVIRPSMGNNMGGKFGANAGSGMSSEMDTPGMGGGGMKGGMGSGMGGGMCGGMSGGMAGIGGAANSKSASMCMGGAGGSFGGGMGGGMGGSGSFGSGMGGGPGYGMGSFGSTVQRPARMSLPQMGGGSAGKGFMGVRPQSQSWFGKGSYGGGMKGGPSMPMRGMIRSQPYSAQWRYAGR